MLRSIIRKMVSYDWCWRLFDGLVLQSSQRVVRCRRYCLNKRLVSLFETNPVVLAGPFHGLVYSSLQSTGSALLPKLLGTYESETHAFVREMARLDVPLVVDIGSAEGYYAIGLARLLPEARVFAYDTSPRARDLCRAMAQSNNVADRVAICGECTATTLLGHDFSDGGIVICDCEGFEKHLFTDEVARHLANAHLLIELHDCVDRRISTYVYSTLKPTHELQIIHSIDDAQKVRQYRSSFVSDDDPIERAIAFSENRSEIMTWAFARPASVAGHATGVAQAMAT